MRLPAFVAALLGLGLNYAAYESEIYRGALEAVSRGQLEAARTLGLTEWQILRLVRGPQAFRLALAPMTNDFVALLKDSSLVSVITVVELTKQTSIFATNIGSWVVPGLLCAAIYLAMSLPLSRLARRLEERWKSAPRERAVLRIVGAPALARGAGGPARGRPRAARGRVRRADGPLRRRQDDRAARASSALETLRGRDDRRGRLPLSPPGPSRASRRSAPLRAQGRDGLPAPRPLRAPDGPART